LFQLTACEQNSYRYLNDPIYSQLYCTDIKGIAQPTVTIGCVGGAAVKPSIIQAAVGSIPSRGVIRAPRSTQPSIPPGIGKSSTSLTGWGYSARLCQAASKIV